MNVMKRIVLAGVLGGLVVFFGGFISHMLFDWSGRTFSRMPNESDIQQFFADKKVAPGIYLFPSMDPAVPKDKTEAEWNRVNELYKKGPAAFVVVHPSGQDMMDGRTLGSEFLSNVVAAVLAAWVVAQLAPNAHFGIRWLVVVIIALQAWASLSWSYQIWYRFPWPFVIDELLCSAFEWSLAALVIASIVRPKPAPAPQPT